MSEDTPRSVCQFDVQEEDPFEEIEMRACSDERSFSVGKAPAEPGRYHLVFEEADDE